MARRVSIVRKSSSRRASEKSWSGITTFETTLAANSQVLVANFTPSVGDDTILRTVGSLYIRSDQLTTSEAQFGALGMAVANEQAVSVGITAVPHPITDIEIDQWFLYVPFCQRFAISGTPADFEPNIYTEYKFDSKAKRVVQNGRQAVVVLQNSSSSGLTFSLVMRVLGMSAG